MHISRSIVTSLRYTSATILRSLATSTAVITTIVISVIIFQNITNTPNAGAITPADTCFGFNSTTGMITDYYYNENNDYVNGTPCPRAIDVPSAIGGITVTGIGDFGLWVKQLTSVTLPNTITSIGNNGLGGNDYTSITIPNTVTSIGNYAFAAGDLTSIVIPSSVSYVGNQAFIENQLASVAFQGTVATIVGGSTFDRNYPLSSISYNGTTYTNATPLDVQCLSFSAGTITNYRQFDINLIKSSGIGCITREITIPSIIGAVPVTSIGDSAFAQNTLTSVTIPSSVTNINSSAFSINNLTTVSIPSSVTSVGAYAFFANQLASIDLPSSVLTIGNYAFDQNRLTSLTLDTGITTIGDSAFSSNQLTTLAIPTSVTSLGVAAFSGNQLTSVSIPSSLTALPESLFRDNLLTSVTIPNSITSIGGAAFLRNMLETLTIPSSVTTIGDYAFDSNNLTILTIPNTVNTVGEEAFGYNQLTSATFLGPVASFGINIFERNYPLDTITYNGAVYTASMPASAECFEFSLGEITKYKRADMNLVKNNAQACLTGTLTIPDDIVGLPVTTIGYAAFDEMKISSVELPGSLTTIDSRAFNGNRLTSVRIPASVTSIHPLAFNQQNDLDRSISDDIYSDDQARIQSALNSISYVRLILENTANPNNFKDEVWSDYFNEMFGFCDEASPCPQDFNGDGDKTDVYTENFGGHLINAVPAIISFTNPDGSELRPTETFTGKMPNSSFLTNYYAVQGPILPEIKYDPVTYDPTPESVAAQRAALTAYYRIGDTYTYTAPVVTGLTPTPASLSYVLGASTQMNSKGFVYSVRTSQSGNLSETGLNTWLIVGIGVVLIGWGIKSTSSKLRTRSVGFDH